MSAGSGIVLDIIIPFYRCFSPHMLGTPPLPLATPPYHRNTMHYPRTYHSL
jgi:hypothetical protein